MPASSWGSRRPRDCRRVNQGRVRGGNEAVRPCGVESQLIPGMQGWFNLYNI